MFDPYYKWLGIRPEHQPPDHYRLLGLDAFEADPEVIQAAAERQMAHVQSYKIGPQSELSQRLLNEIARAKACLLKPQAKATYDRQLQHKLSPPQLPAVRHQRQPPVTVPATPMPVPQPPQFNLRTPVARRRRTSLLLPTLLACVATLMLAVAVVLVANSEGLLNRPATETAAISASRPAQPVVMPKQPNIPVTQPSPPVVPSRPKSRPTPPAPPVKAPSGKRPIPDATEQEKARKAITIEGDLTARQFLDAARDATHSSLRYVLYQMAIEAAIKVKDTEHILATRIALQALESLEEEFELDSDFKNQVLERLRVESAGPVAMAPSAPESSPSQQVDAAVSPRPSDAQKSSSRTSVTAPLIDLTKTQIDLPITLPEGMNVDPKTLKLEAIGIANVSFNHRFPTDGRAAHNKPVQLVIRNQVPKAGIELSLRGRNPITVRVKPILEDFDGKLYPWTQERMKTLEGVFVREINQCAAAIPRLKAQIPNLQAAVDVARRAPRNEYSRPFLDLQQRQAEAAVANARDELSKQEQRLPHLKKQAEAFSEVFKLAASVHQVGKIQFRVYLSSGDEEVTIHLAE